MVTDTDPRDLETKCSPDVLQPQPPLFKSFKELSPGLKGGVTHIEACED